MANSSLQQNTVNNSFGSRSMPNKTSRKSDHRELFVKHEIPDFRYKNYKQRGEINVAAPYSMGQGTNVEGIYAQDYRYSQYRRPTLPH